MVREPIDRFGDTVLPFNDPDGLEVELVGVRDDPRPACTNGPVPGRHAIHGVHSVTLAEEGYERTAALLTETLGFVSRQEQDARFRYLLGAGSPGAIVDVLCVPDSPPGRMGVGTVHHVAWRTVDDAQQSAWREAIARAGLNVTPVRDRTYFRSIYFREPGGVLFEIATDSPGFAVDEPLEQLGSHLRLPPWLETMRPQIVQALPRLDLPAAREGVVPW
jgi:catechol 2,3-dioxygenase-like lactoylglutathione lyase family enzyme